jgi:hypothetical protein
VRSIKKIVNQIGVNGFSIVIASKKNAMKKNMMLTMAALIIGVTYASAQEIQTIFKPGKSGGYGAITNSFTTIGGKYANMAGVYGGWYVNSKFLIGVGAKAVTNDLPVLPANSTIPGVNMSYAYGQFGLVTEYVVRSNRMMHVAFQLFTGAGFTGQYQRTDWNNDYEPNKSNLDENFFTVIEPGVQVEFNLLKWMRFSPGVSYRATFGSDAVGLSDSDLSNISYNLTLKFGRF